MGATHVFVETNWLVECFAPAHFATRASRELFQIAKQGRLTLHVPGICLGEARGVIRRKFQPRSHADPLRSYIRWAREKNQIDPRAEEIVRRCLDHYEVTILAELESLENQLATLRNDPEVDVFPLTENMLELALSLGAEKLELRPFDYAILPAILTRAAEIKREEPNAEVFFCELDGDLQPWDKNGNVKPTLAGLYDDAHVWVYGDFGMRSPARPDAWPR